MGTITTPPRGLISLFGLRDMGAVPADLSEQVAPTIDITEFCLTNRESVQLQVNAIAGLGTSFFGTVPANELWYVHSFTLVVPTLAAGQSIRLRPVLADSGLLFVRGASGTATAGERLAVGTDRMFLATPGQVLCGEVEALAGAPVTVSGMMLITRLRMS